MQCSVTSISTYNLKINFTMQFVLEIIGFKKTDENSILSDYSRTRFFTKCSFCNIKKHIMIIILSQKALNQWTGYLAKTTKALNWENFWTRKIHMWCIWEKVFSHLYQPIYWLRVLISHESDNNIITLYHDIYNYI